MTSDVMRPGREHSFLREHSWLVSVISMGVLIGGWQSLAWSGALPGYIHGPVQILRAMAVMAASGDLAAQVGSSLYRALSGFLIGGLAGLVLGLLAGVSRVFRDLFDLTQSFTHAVPKIAIFPVIAVLLGFTDPARILVISLSCFYPAYLNALNGALGINPRLLWVARNMGASRLRTFLQVVVPAAMPRALVGLRISLMVSFVLMVATEVVGHSNGLGAGLMLAYRDGDYGTMYAGIATVALCGVLANAVLQAACKYLFGGRFASGVAHG